MLFVRDFRAMQGGHLKVFDYYQHAAAGGAVRPLLFMTPDSLRDQTNPWFAAGVAEQAALLPADSYFLAGLDWELLDRAGIDPGGKPTVNLVQHFRHTDPADPRYRYLRRPALRICVSAELADAVRASGMANGPVVAVPNGVDLTGLAPYRGRAKTCDAFVAGLKNPELAAAVGAELARHGLCVDVALELRPRAEFLARLAAARVAVLLPIAGEGFFLPALEAMALGSAVVVPDCGGNRGFCRDGETALVPPYSAAGLSAAALALWREPARRERLVAAGNEQARAHGLDRERAAFARLLQAHLSIG